jgi:hypothetical protein
VNERGEVVGFAGKFWGAAQSRLTLAPTGEKREDCAGGAMAAVALGDLRCARKDICVSAPTSVTASAIESTERT